MKIRELPFVSAVAAALSVVIVWLGVGLPVLGRLAVELLALCHSIFEMCGQYKGISLLVMLFLGASIVAGGVGYGLTSNLFSFFKAGAAIKAMPKLDIGSSVVLIRDDATLSAFTWGLFRPRIYLSTGLVAILTRDELAAVCLHECRHRAGFDPLRFFLLSVLSDIFVYIPLVRHLAAYLRAEREFAADDYAAQRVGEAVSLASALLKVSGAGGSAVPVPAAFAGFGGPSERITRLLNINGQKAASVFSRIPLRTAFVSLSMAVFLTAALVGSISASPEPVGVCATERCSLHAHNHDMGGACKRHCKTDKAGQLMR